MVRSGGCWNRMESCSRYVNQTAFFNLGGGFKCFLFSPLLGQMIPIDKYFSDGLKPPNIFNVDWYFGSCGTSQQIWSDDLIL